MNVRSLIKNQMPVVCSDDHQFAVVDHLEGTDAIKLVKDADGQHHYIPLAWVSSVDDKVHIDRPGEQARQEWTATLDDPATLARDIEAPRHLNSSDATMGQPILQRVTARKQELEVLLGGLPDDELRSRGDIELALGTIDALLTGDLAHLPAVVVADMNKWLEQNKHLAETAIEIVVDPVTAPIAAAVPPEA